MLSAQYTNPHPQQHRKGGKKIVELRDRRLQIHRDEQIDRVKDERAQIVRGDACDGRKRQPALIMGEVVGVDGHGLCPAESRQGEKHEAQNIEVRQRVQGQPPADLRRQVAAFIGDEGVRKFVQGQHDGDSQ